MRWVLLGLLASCGDDDDGKLGEHEPCTSTEQCAANLYCDFHDGNGTCEPGHDHEPDCQVMPQECTFTDGDSMDGESSLDGATTIDSDSAESGTAESGSADSGDSGGEGIACGDALVCNAAEVCVEEPNAPLCEPLPRGEMCPRGTAETSCGGAGLPCCCGPTPPSDYRCASAEGCEPPTCECLPMLCMGGDTCGALAEPRNFRCEPPAAP